MTFTARRSDDGKWVEITNDSAVGSYFDEISLVLDTDDRSEEVASEGTVERIVRALNGEFYPDA